MHDFLDSHFDLIITAQKSRIPGSCLIEEGLNSRRYILKS